MKPPNRADMVVTKWGARFRGRRFACAIGRGGIRSNKAEGDGASPAGIWHITGGRYRPDRTVKPLILKRDSFQLKPAGLYEIWSDDSLDPNYNHSLHAPAHPYGHERLRRADPLYDIVLFSDWNWPDTVPAKGSAIFIHAWRKPRYPTAGCIAFAPGDLRWIITRWSPFSRIFVG